MMTITIRNVQGLRTNKEELNNILKEYKVNMAIIMETKKNERYERSEWIIS